MLGTTSLSSRDRVGAGRQHGVDRIPAPTKQAGLRSVAVERNAEPNTLPVRIMPAALHDILRRDVIERADLIVRAPALSS